MRTAARHAPGAESPGSAGSLLDIVRLLAGEHENEAVWDVGDLLYIGLGLATIGMVTGVAVGTMLVNYPIKSPSIPVARQLPLTKTSTSIIICRAPMTRHWTSGRGCHK